LVTATIIVFQDHEDGEFLDAPYPHDEDIPMRDKAHIHGPKCTQFPVL